MDIIKALFSRVMETFHRLVHEKLGKEENNDRVHAALVSKSDCRYFISKEIPVESLTNLLRTPKICTKDQAM